jgi:hypothetical protein
MEEKEDEDIRRRRSGGGRANIGTGEDGAILEMVNINEHLITIKEKSIYEFVLADTLDPERKRPNLPPNMHTKLLDRGSEDELVARTFLTAKTVFNHKHYPDSVNANKALLDMLDVVKELAAMETEIAAYNVEHNKACKLYEERDDSRGFMLPAVPDMLTRCKTIFQKADQACQYLMVVIRVFYPEVGIKKYYTDFEEIIQGKYGQSDPFARFLAQVVPFIMEIRRARNCLDHRKEELKLIGFELQDDNSVLSPTIEMNDAGSTIVRQDLLTYIKDAVGGLISLTEHMIPYLASKHIQPMGLIPVAVRMVPESQRLHKMIQFALWAPIGEDGIYFF